MCLVGGDRPDINQFKDSIFFGHGIKSFRLLCDNPKYAPFDKIEKDSLRTSPENGYFFLINDINHEGHAHVVGKKKNIYPISINDPDLIYKHRVNKKISKIYFKNGQYIEKNKPIFFEKYEFDNGCNTHPHNVHLQFLAETGLIGYSFLIISLLFVVFHMFLILKKKILRITIDKKELHIFFCLIGLFLSIFPFFPSGNFFNNWLSSIFYFNVANLLSILPLKKK
jgi:O-antigen ligase